MKVHKGFTQLNIRNAVVTTGSFDGVHVGHSLIIDRLNKRARELQGESVLITFYPHPRKILYPDTVGKNLQMINSQDEKIRLLAELGLDHLIIVEFTLEFSKTSSVDFIRKYLVSQLQVRHVIIGFNHHFGHNREGDLEYLEELGKYYQFTVEEIPEQDIQNESVSSTKIRRALSEGNIQRANAYLDHSYQLSGQISDIISIGDKTLYEVSGVDDEKLVPPSGSYAVSCLVGEGRRKGVVWLVGGDDKGISQILVKFDENPKFREGQLITLDFHKCLSRNSLSAFPGEKVIDQDLQLVRELIY